MKIILLEGSPNRHGSSNMLAEHFKRGGGGGWAQRGDH